MLAGANWQRGGGKGGRPKPLQRPDPRREKRNREVVAKLARLGHLDDPPAAIEAAAQDPTP